MFQHEEQQGFLTLAIGEQYLTMAYLQALSIKLVMPDARYCVVTDAETKDLLTEKHIQTFDYIKLVESTDWPMNREPDVFVKSPFKETIKIEADLVFTRNVDHWWDALRLKPIVLSTNCRNFKDEVVVDTNYRKFWVDNDLPNIYNGMMYFRFTREATEFFQIARSLYKHYDYIRDNVLINCREKRPSTDVIYALAAKILGIDKCTIPSLDYFNFVHMKPHIQGWPGADKWTDTVMCETDPPILRINNINQLNPVHYHVKEWCTQELIEQYERA
jgi:hypothetical protein